MTKATKKRPTKKKEQEDNAPIAGVPEDQEKPAPVVVRTDADALIDATETLIQNSERANKRNPNFELSQAVSQLKSVKKCFVRLKEDQSQRG